MNKMHLATLGLGIVAVVCLMGDDCNNSRKLGSDGKQQEQQERILAEGTAAVGMPAIKNFRERKLMKDIIEMRDQTNLLTYTYIWSDHHRCHTWVCDSIGYGIPYSTQFTNPQKFVRDEIHYGVILPQADPNGLFSPGSADGTWVMCKDPNSDKVAPVHFEPRMTVSPFKLATCSSTVEKKEEEKKK